VAGFLSLSGWFLLWNLVMQLMRGSDVVVLGIAASPELVTVYALARYVPEAIFGAVAIVISAIMPGLGGLVGARDAERAAGVRSESMAVTWLLATAGGAAFLLLQESFLTLWVGKEYYPGATANLLIILLTVQFAFIRNDASIIDLTLKLRGKVLLGLLSAGLSIGLAVLLVGTWELGITGLVLGFLAGRSILTVAYPWLVGRSLGISPYRQVRGAVRPMLVCGALFAASAAVAPLVDVGSWIGLVGIGIASFIAFAGASFVLGLSAGQRQRLASRLTQVVRRV
jgi:O-antigen/teichoic acid export membrane protein